MSKSDDGADLNMRAEGAMKAALGGGQPERMTDEAFEQMIRTATPNPKSYNDGANRAARLVLEYLEANPSAATLDIDALYSALKASVSEEDREKCLMELSGFMWGWAVNAARHIMKLHPVPNPAIVHIKL